MSTLKPETGDLQKSLETEVEAALNPGEAEGFYRDTRECLGLLLVAGAALLSPPTPRPKK
ncbi:hypothetical protein [Streptomyces alkaliterrae]|uniref:Uncharacterized protein n=1 Tax=Streptomyces alkaliterrae TaxID=2213162 RepID=A0A5P0YTT5_9ACTN|nr:hypothetical protein [Streptomyces alkaliterrae]MBB1256412.1 hypothetical protein [Streptomyces alkaliterrae]MBB1259990.1 hypothetical protein [Streptomyces alkaliterrae]MQS02852.1 hypothetical protein [Streptomyces alkaliterrae]